MNARTIRRALAGISAVHATLLLLACSGDDTIPVAPDAGDATVGDGALIIPPPGDANAPSDGGVTDADATVIDAGGDAAPRDASGDADADADARPATVTSIIGSAVGQFCVRLGECCNNGLANAPTWNQALCSQTILGSRDAPFFGLGTHRSGTIDAGDALTLDMQQAAQCLGAARAWDCTITSAQVLAIRDACFGALRGTVTQGQACSDAIQCAPGLRCVAGDGGSTCVPLANNSDPCDGVDDCAYRGTSTPLLYCSIDPATHPDGGGTCATRLAAATPCQAEATEAPNACQSGICAAEGGTCAVQVLQNTDVVCTSFNNRILDSGTD